MDKVPEENSLVITGKTEIQEKMWKSTGTFPASTHITFANITLALASHVAKPAVRVGGDYKVTI